MDGLDPILDESDESIQQEETLPAMTDSISTTNGASPASDSEGDNIMSMYFMKKEVERLKEVLREERENSSVDLCCKHRIGVFPKPPKNISVLPTHMPCIDAIIVLNRDIQL